MPGDFQYDVFLSHSSKDKPAVREVAERLRGDGVKVWFDEWEIKPGDSIPARIEEGLEQSRALVLCMSGNAFGSDWAQLESYTYRFKDPLNKERRFIPLRLDEANIKGSLAQFLYINWHPNERENEYAKLVDACRAKPEQERLKKQNRELLSRIVSLGHSGEVCSVAISPDGLSALTGSADNTVRLWEVESGRGVGVLEGHIGAVWSVSWSPDGKHALSGSADNTVRLWEVESGRCVRVLEGHTNRVRSVSWSPDGKRALSGSEDVTVRVWEVESGRCVRVLEGHTSFVWSVSWSPDGKRALSGSSDQTVRVWEVESGRCMRVLKAHTSAVWSVAWSPDEKRALSGSADQTVRVWEVESGRCVRVLEGHISAVLSVSWSPDGKRALSGSADQTVRLWEVESGLCVRVLEGHTSEVWSVSWSPDGKRALSGSVDETVRLWEVESGRCVRVLEGHNGPLLSMSWSPDGKRALSGSEDDTVRLWEMESGRCVRVLEGHTSRVWSVSWSPDGKHALSGSQDYTIRLWEVESGRCVRVLKGHTNRVLSVSWSPDGKRALSGSEDDTVRLWEVESGRCMRVLEGHTSSVWSVSWSPDGKHALSGSQDQNVRIWEVESGRCVGVLKGHTGRVWSVSWNPNGKRALSGSHDQTVRLWEVESGRCVRVLEGHKGPVLSVSWSTDGTRALSGSDDNAVRFWEMESGRCVQMLVGHTGAVGSLGWSPDGRQALSAAENGIMRIWDLSEEIFEVQAQQPISNIKGTAKLTFSARGTLAALEQVEYTNAKVLLVGDTNAGKTGLTHRLATGEWKPSEDSTVGAWSTQWPLKDAGAEAGVDREIWLWDFGGQADQRLIHQLYMDRTALILLLFNADQEDVLPGLRDWQTALRRCVKAGTPHLLIAGRIDTGFKASRGKLQTYAEEQGFTYLETSAKEGQGCEEVRAAIAASIPWDQMEKRTSPRIFKLIKDAILKLRDEGKVLHTFKELREHLWQRLPDEPRFSDEILQTVIGLLDGPGVVKELDYGTYILLAPEWINAYAQAVIRTLRSAENDLGVLPLRSIAEGKLIYQSIGRDGVPVNMKRLPPAEERVVLGEMERQLEQRGLCLRQGDKLVFPSHCGRDRSAILKHPSIFVSYGVKGFLDDIYATLVVKLADSESFRLKELWRDAADFVTLQGDFHMGIKLTRETASEGNVSVYFGKGVSEGEQVIFANYIHAHLVKHDERAQRLRYYVCPKCQTPKGNPEVLMKKLRDKKKNATVECDACEERFSLWDDLEKMFASDEVRKEVEGLQAVDAVRLDSRRKGKLLALEVGSRITSADQKCFEIPATEDEGIDMELEFTNEQGKGTGRRLYLQLKSGNSHLEKRKSGKEIFMIREQRWVKYWLAQRDPVMLVIGTFDGDEAQMGGKDKLEFAEVRWMEISSVLKRESQNGTKPVKQIEFAGERLDMTSVHKWRERVLGKENKTEG